MMVDSAAGASACPVDYAPECEVKPGSVKLHLVGAGGDSIEHIGQKTITRDGANVEIAFEAAEVRRPLLSVGSLVEERTGGNVHRLWLASSSRGLRCKGIQRRELKHEATERSLLAATRSTC